MRRAAAAVATVLGVAVLSACSGPSGDTRCEEFVVMSSADRTALVEQLLADQGQADPTPGTVELYVSTAIYRCLDATEADTPVADVLE